MRQIIFTCFTAISVFKTVDIHCIYHFGGTFVLTMRQENIHRCLEKVMPHVQVSLQRGGIYDNCFLFCKPVQLVPVEIFASKISNVSDHLEATSAATFTNKSTRLAPQTLAIINFRRFKIATVSIKFAAQLFVLLLSDQTLIACTKNFHDVNIFWIIDEINSEREHLFRIL